MNHPARSELTTTGGLRRWAVRLAVVLVLGVALHVAWVILSILAASLGASSFARGALWLAGPIITAAGYAIGLTIPVRGAAAINRRFSQLFLVVLVGCAVGGLLGRPVGPMFAGLGMLSAGALAAAALVVGTARRDSEPPKDRGTA